jgi:predicted regulator of Ras-like GTPase activity (Roadblock/LC7/MglB family)
MSKKYEKHLVDSDGVPAAQEVDGADDAAPMSRFGAILHFLHLDRKRSAKNKEGSFVVDEDAVPINGHRGKAA